MDAGEGKETIMPKRYSQNQLTFARKLRREDTRSEEILWNSLKASQLDGLKFRRQVPIGIYVVDFLCVKLKFIVELDGVVHEAPEQIAHDIKRDAWLKSKGYKILRIHNDLIIGGGNISLNMIRDVVLKLRC
jgi:very-short-patch-repair endonuclease